MSLKVRLFMSRYDSRFPKTWQVFVGKVMTGRGMQAGFWQAKVREHLEDLGLTPEEIEEIFP